MRYTLFGRTGLRVSEMCLGTMTFGEPGGGADKDMSRRIVDAYADAGGNFIDTANIYADGNSETILGEVLAGRRESFVLASKYGCATRKGDANAAGNHRKSLIQSVEASLARLRTDHLDVLWVHVRDNFTPVDEVMRALDDLVRAGKVLYMGVSDWPAWEIAHANTRADAQGWTSFAGSQLRYNLLDRTPERELLPQARAFDQAVLAWSPLAGGKLTGKYRRGETGRLSTQAGNGGAHHDEDQIITTVLEIAKQGGWAPAQVALAWLREQPGNIIPIIGATQERQLADNLAAVEVVDLDRDALARLDDVSAVSLGFPHDDYKTQGVAETVYGDRWADIDDRRSTYRRTTRDIL